ncbi:MAG TPA: 2Fe-2S iron-sulfur cluster-binding protein [Casimicrobiaceae bacterium]|nr:2Fe-2S iron-sulfur cluster-binding protein [Casimicrobiaceae bacterium]
MDSTPNASAARVTARPSGHEFVVEGRETLLEAGLKAGLRLDYGCGNGTCGLCRARVIEGAATKVMAHDYPLSEADRQQGLILLCAHSAGAGDLVIETQEATDPSQIRPQELTVRIRGVEQVAPNTLLLHLQTPRQNRLRFFAGQSVTLAYSDGSDARRAYPIASCPCDERNLHFHVARDPDDALAAMLFAGVLRCGDSLSLRGPSGAFVLQDDGRPSAFIACDTGFAPIRSLIEHAIAQDAAAPLSLDWLALRQDGHYLANQCRAWAAAFDDFRYAAHTAADPESGAAAIVANLGGAFRLDGRDIYVAGPAAFVAATVARLEVAGVPPRQVRAATV